MSQLPLREEPLGIRIVDESAIVSSHASTTSASLSTHNDNEFDTVSSADSDGSQASKGLSYSSGSDDESVDQGASVNERERQTKEFIAWARASSSTLQASSFECDELASDFSLEVYVDDAVNVDAQAAQTHRQQEINWFASHANSDNMGSNATFDKFTYTDTNILCEAGSAIFTDLHTSSNSISLQMDGQVGGLKKHHNLAAALEYLANPDKPLGKYSHAPQLSTAPAPPSPIRMAKRRKPINTRPYSECVMIPRPLFFGHSLPARVLDEAQKLVASARSKTNRGRSLSASTTDHPTKIIGHGSRPTATNRASITSEHDTTCYIQLPPQYKNFQDSIDVYGFGSGTGIFSSQSSEMDTRSLKSNEGNPYICLFQPVWGDLARLEREDRIRSRQCVTDVDGALSTAPTAETPPNKDSPKHYNTMKPNMFSFYARADADAGSRKITLPGDELVGETFSTSSAFVAMKRTTGSLNQSEWEKIVGANDNITKALSSLEPESSSTHRGSSFSGDGNAGEAAVLAAEAWKMPSEDGRPLTNLELTGGLVPLYACEDSALPSAADLGLYDYEGSDDQVKYMVQTRAQEFIQSHSVPDVFGMIACPPCSHPDDSERNDRLHSSLSFEANNDDDDNPWPITTSLKLKSVPSSEATASSHQFVHHHQSIPSSEGIENLTTTENSATTRGWWNTLDDTLTKDSPTHDSNSPPLILCPDKSHRMRTSVGPSPSELMKNNRSLSELHPATSILKSMPLLSDRNPLTRFIQIDIEAVTFPMIGEIEPFFCSLSLWDMDAAKSIQITESFHFDFVTDKNIEQLWSSILNPYSGRKDKGTRHFSDHGSRCGLFPIPSSLNFSSLYAILLVRRALSNDDELLSLYADDAPKKKLFRLKSESPRVDKIEVWREKAYNKAAKYSHIQSPFAFGILPLAEAVGSENPSAATRRSLEMPLFYAGTSDMSQLLHSYFSLR